MTDSIRNHYGKLDALFTAVQSARIERDENINPANAFEGAFDTPSPKFDRLIEILRTTDALDVLEKEIAL